MQQREQLILKKLAEAREAQTSAMTRFIQARARAMQVEARLRSAQAHASHQEEVSPASATTAPPTPLTETTPAENVAVIKPAFTLPSKATIPETPAPVLDLDQLSLASDLSELIDEAGLDALAHVLAGEPAADQAVQDVPTVQLTEPGQSNDEETKKQPTVPLSTPPATPQPSGEEEETLLVSMSALIAARQAREAVSAEKEVQQSAEAPPTEEASGTDITTKIPVIRRQSRTHQEQA